MQQALYNIHTESHGADKILKYKELLDQGLITEEEF
ncbi:SHOCT domain-containing protein [Bacillus pacificus]